MEQWEKEYLEIIRENKERCRNSDKTASQKQKEYIEACWQEVERTDGTKYYIPDKKKLDKQARKRKFQRKVKRFKETVFGGIKKVLRAMLVIIIITSLVKSDGLSGRWELLRMLLPTHRVAVSSTDINGKGFASMMDTLEGIRKRNSERMNTYAANGYSYPEGQIEKWLIDIDADIQTLEELNYHSSYKELVGCYSEFLIIIKNIVNCLEYGSGNVRNELESYNAILEKMKSSLISALEENNIPYSDTKAGLVYQYMVY